VFLGTICYFGGTAVAQEKSATPKTPAKSTAQLTGATSSAAPQTDAKKNSVPPKEAASGKQPAPSTAAKTSPEKCLTNPKITYTRILAVPGNYDSVAARCGDLSKAECSDPGGFSAFATSSEGQVKAACPIEIFDSYGQFGIDDSDGFKADFLIVNWKGDNTPQRFSVNASPLKQYRQIVSANFGALNEERGQTLVCTEAYPCRGYIQNADGSETRPLSIYDMSDYSATLEYEASDKFKPASYLVSYSSTDGHPRSQAFPFSLVEPQVESTQNFTGSDLTIVDSGACGDPNDPKTLVVVRPSPAESSVTIERIALAQGILIARVIAPSAYVPSFVVVSVGPNKVCQGLIARRSTSPPVDERTPNISFTLVDQETIRRDFGTRMKENYLVAMVEVHNPTAKKLQLNKSALWFDVDYVEAYDEKRPFFLKRWVGLGSDLDANKVFIPRDAHVFRYGIDHTQRHYPHNFGQILGAFDATASFKNKEAQGFELVGAILSGIASVAASENLNTSTHLVAGLLIPGVKSILLNPDDENRKRSNLVTQGLQNYVQIPPSGTASTLVFLPRKGMLAVIDRGEKPLVPRSSATKNFDVGCNGVKPGDFKVEDLKQTPNPFPGMDRPAICDQKPFGGASSETRIIEPDAAHRLVPVVLKKVLEVQWDPEVISEVNEEVVALGVLKPGMTKEQVRQCCGEPENVATASDKTSCFLYQEGKYSKVCFDAAGLSSTWTALSMAQQVTAAGTYDKVRTLLLGGGPAAPTEKRDLVDGSFVWFNAPQIQTSLRFDSKGNLTDPDYKEKFDQISVLKGKTKKEFDQTIESLALNDPTKKAITDAAKSTQNPIAYPSPDLKGENVDVTFNPTTSAAKKIADDWTVDQVERTLRKQ
jgi:hypothetical protein